MMEITLSVYCEIAYVLTQIKSKNIVDEVISCDTERKKFQQENNKCISLKMSLLVNINLIKQGLCQEFYCNN